MITQIYEARSSNEAKSLVEAGVDYVGVLVSTKDKYPGILNLEQAIIVLNEVTGGAKKVILPFTKDLNEISLIAKKIKPDILHIAVEPGDISPTDIQALKKQFPDIKIMRTIPVVDEDSVNLAKQYDGVADYLLLDSRSKKNNQIGVTGETHDWKLSKKSLTQFLSL